VTNGSRSATYSYLANSPLVGQITFRNDSGSTATMITVKQYDYLNRLTSISNSSTALGALPLSYAYDYNNANQRVRTTLADGSYWRYEYDSLGQVISGKRYWSDGTPVAGQQFEYGFDDIGNRKSTKAGGDENGWNLRSASYTANNLNQYTSRDVPGYVDVMGISFATNTVTVNSQAPYRKVEYFRKELSVNNSSAPVWQSVTVQTNGVTGITGNVFIPQTNQMFSYDLDGNLTNDGRWAFTWDAENRLTKLESLSTSPTASKRKVEWVYDAKGRRIQQTTYDLSSGSEVVTENLKFVYDGWKCLAELNATNNALVRHYAWGLDLSGSMDGAGGVGGLLWMRSGPAVHFCQYDGNGNVVGLVQGNGAQTAVYEYDPFGRTIRITGAQSKNNPYRFSTKRANDTTDFVLYEYRLYDPSTGRWLNRDPIGEDGGFNLYGFVYNSPVNRIDPKGLNSLLSIASGCAMSLLTKSIDKKLDQQFVCKELADRMRGVTEPRKGEQDAYDIDLCNGFQFQPYFPPGHHPESLAKTLRNCILSGLKGKAVEKALEEVTDPVKKKILEELLNAASDPDVDARINVNVDVKCVNKKAQLTLNYSTAVSVNGRSATLENQTVGPFGCSIGTQLFGGKKLDDCCANCDQDKKKK
jgi:RHS repeat-associated protein